MRLDNYLEYKDKKEGFFRCRRLGQIKGEKTSPRLASLSRICAQACGV